MLDLETWGTQPGSALRSIGLVQFDPRTAGFGEEMYCNMDLESQEALGATRDPGTIKWWEEQGQAAKDVLEKNQLPIKDAIQKVCMFFRRTKCQYVWAQGSNFDPVLLEATMKLINVRPPWRFYNTRDTRTAYSIASLDSKKITRKGIYHYALDDAKHQIRCVYMAYKLLHGEKQ